MVDAGDDAELGPYVVTELLANPFSLDAIGRSGEERRYEHAVKGINYRMETDLALRDAQTIAATLP